MLFERGFGGVFVTGRNSTHNPFVLPLRDGSAPLSGKRGCRHQRHGPVHQIKLLYEVAIVRR